MTMAKQVPKITFTSMQDMLDDPNSQSVAIGLPTVSQMVDSREL